MDKCKHIWLDAPSINGVVCHVCQKRYSDVDCEKAWRVAFIFITFIIVEGIVLLAWLVTRH